MPANLTPEYRNAERAFKEAETLDERIEALKHMLAVIPKHKGTDHLQGDLKRRLAKLRREGQEKQSRGKRGHGVHIPKEGAGQVILLGPPNVGKSSLLAAVTSAHPEIADYPYTTQQPIPGMMAYEDVPIQLIDMPPITRDFMESWVPTLVRNADAALLVIDLSSDELLDQAEMLVEVMEASRVRFVPNAPGGDHNAPIVQRTGFLLCNKCDVDGATDRLEILKDLYGGGLPVLPVSAMAGHGLESMRLTVYQALRVLRVYTKKPGTPPDMAKPFTLRLGSTVEDLARTIHKDFAEHLKSARVWGSSKFDGQTVRRDHVLADKDVVEISGGVWK